MKSRHGSKKKLLCMLILILILLVTAVIVLNQMFIHSNDGIPALVLPADSNNTDTKALVFGYSWGDGRTEAKIPDLPVWKGELTEENTFIYELESVQEGVPLSVRTPITAEYVVYFQNGIVYDDGKRDIYSSQASLLNWTHDGIAISLPFKPGTYIYELTLTWENSLEVIYGFAVRVVEQAE